VAGSMALAVVGVSLDAEAPSDSNAKLVSGAYEPFLIYRATSSKESSAGPGGDGLRWYRGTHGCAAQSVTESTGLSSRGAGGSYATLMSPVGTSRSACGYTVSLA